MTQLAFIHIIHVVFTMLLGYFLFNTYTYER
jgi:hypothetical protein